MEPITTTEPSIEDELPLPHAAACDACGAPIEKEDKFCTACGTSNVVDVKIVEESEQQQKFFQCKNCGSTVATDIQQRSYVCAFCDSTYVVEFTPDETDRQRPEFVIGFAVTHEKALEKFNAWIHENKWFRPGDLKQSQIAEKLKGVYLPFWSFSMLAESNWQASIGEYWYTTETYTTTENGKTVTKTRTVRHTEWWPLVGKHHRFYSGYLISASGGLSQDQAQRIKPFHLPALKRYEPYFLAGWLCEEYSVAADLAKDRCMKEFHRREQENITELLPGDTYNNLTVQSEFSRENSDLILLPIYLLTYKYQDKLYRFMVNGQTGKVAGDKPLSWKRIGSAIGLAILLIIIVILLFMFSR